MRIFGRWFAVVMAVIAFSFWLYDRQNDQKDQSGLSQPSSVDTSEVKDASPLDIVEGKDIADCTIVNEAIAGPKWQSCNDNHHRLLIDTLRKLENVPGESQSDVLNSTMDDATRIYETGKHNYLQGFQDHDQLLSSVGQLQETFIDVSLANAVGALINPRPDEFAPLDEAGRYNTGHALKLYQETKQSIAVIPNDAALAAKCEDSVDALSDELEKGNDQIAQSSVLDTRVASEEYYLRVNYGDMLIGNASARLTCFQSALNPSQ